MIAVIEDKRNECILPPQVSQTFDLTSNQNRRSKIIKPLEIKKLTMVIPTKDLPISETEANRRWNLPVWLVLICVVIFSVLLGAEIVLIGAIAFLLSIRILGEAKCWTGM